MDSRLSILRQSRNIDYKFWNYKQISIRKDPLRCENGPKPMILPNYFLFTVEHPEPLIFPYKFFGINHHEDTKKGDDTHRLEDNFLYLLERIHARGYREREDTGSVQNTL